MAAGCSVSARCTSRSELKGASVPRWLPGRAGHFSLVFTIICSLIPTVTVSRTWPLLSLSVSRSVSIVNVPCVASIYLEQVEERACHLSLNVA